MKGPPADAVRAARHSKDDLDMEEAGPRAAARRAARALVPGLRRALDRPVAQLLTGLLTVFALFGDDVSATCPRAVMTLFHTGAHSGLRGKRERRLRFLSNESADHVLLRGRDRRELHGPL